MLLRNIRLPESSLHMRHLLKHESIVRQTSERFLVRFECALEVAQNAIAINALREPCFPELRLERHRPIRGVLHRRTAVHLQIKAVEIKLAARDGEARPSQRKLRIKLNRLAVKADGP